MSKSTTHDVTSLMAHFKPGSVPSDGEFAELIDLAADGAATAGWDERSGQIVPGAGLALSDRGALATGNLPLFTPESVAQMPESERRAICTTLENSHRAVIPPMQFSGDGTKVVHVRPQSGTDPHPDYDYAFRFESKARQVTLTPAPGTLNFTLGAGRMLPELGGGSGRLIATERRTGRVLNGETLALRDEVIHSAALIVPIPQALMEGIELKEAHIGISCTDDARRAVLTVHHLSTSRVIIFLERGENGEWKCTGTWKPTDSNDAVLTYFVKAEIAKDSGLNVITAGIDQCFYLERIDSGRWKKKLEIQVGKDQVRINQISFDGVFFGVMSGRGFATCYNIFTFPAGALYAIPECVPDYFYYKMDPQNFIECVIFFERSTSLTSVSIRDGSVYRSAQHNLAGKNPIDMRFISDTQLYIIYANSIELCNFKVVRGSIYLLEFNVLEKYSSNVSGKLICANENALLIGESGKGRKLTVRQLAADWSPGFSIPIQDSVGLNFESVDMSGDDSTIMVPRLTGEGGLEVAMY